MKKFFDRYPETPQIGSKDSSVHKSDFRFKIAEKEAQKPIVSVEIIAKYVNHFLSSIGMKTIENPIYSLNEIPIKNNIPKIDYKNIQKTFNLKNINDIVWIKLTQDGYVGVVAVSNDVNFDYPISSDVYHKKTSSGKWLYFTSGILIHHVNKTWDTSFVLLFPLIDIPEIYQRVDIERAIGNYLIEQNVPIIDFYSHNY